MRTTISLSTMAGACLLLTFASAAWSQPAAPTPTEATNATPAVTGTPKIQFAETTHNFGRVSVGQVIKAEFTFTNTGDGTLEITEVKPHCGCTVAGTWDKTVAPGMTGKIPLQVNTANFNGMVSKSATITCNAPGHPTINLIITGTVWKPLEVSPNVVAFNFPAGHPTNDTRIVTIKNNADEPLAISDIQSGHPAFRAEVKEIQPGKQFELLISSVSESITGRVQSAVTFKTSSATTPLITITTLANPQEPPATPLPTPPPAPAANNPPAARILRLPQPSLPTIPPPPAPPGATTPQP